MYNVIKLISINNSIYIYYNKYKNVGFGLFPFGVETFYELRFCKTPRRAKNDIL
jgi:hypothetical protein